MPDDPKRVAVSNTEDTDPIKKVNEILGPSLSEQSLSDVRLKAATDRHPFNASSYSGADIKVLVHKYHEGPGNILSQLDAAVGIYSQIADRIALIDVRFLKLLVTKGEQKDISQVDYTEDFEELWFAVIRKLAQLEATLPEESHFFLGIAKEIRGLTVAVQENAFAIDPVLKRIEQRLRDFVSGWKSERKNIAKLQKDGRFFQTKTLAELQTISVSTFREKTGVRAFGKSNTQGYVRGQRTIAGSMIFTVFDRNVLLELLDFDPSDFDGDNRFKAAILDQLPPIDITIQFANEYGSLSRMTIYGVEFVSEGQTMSIEDILLENVVQYIARDIDPMTPVVDQDGNPYSTTLSAYNQSLAGIRRPERPVRATDLIGSEYGRTEGDEDDDLSVTRFRRRNNPFF